MAYASEFPIGAVAVRQDFRRFERIVVLLGATALGALAGFALAMSTGRVELWSIIVFSAPVLALALYLTAQTLTEALRRDASGCALAATVHGAALLAWPLTSLLTPLSPMSFWIAPAAALATLVLLSSCWGGGSPAVYRTGLQGALVAALAAHQGMFVVMGA